ncbi:MAG TPA: hypothetical protein VFL54_10125 [Gammaproteobacteria bacterium]|nr:hypothetical protein [Gammaproteobacteria bacterium]
MADNDTEFDLRMDPNGLYREEIFTDRNVGTLQRLTPITADGGTDSARPVVYVGQTQLLTPVGSLPISFEIEASSLNEAAEKFATGAKAAVAETMERLQELRRETASSLLVPGAQGGGGFGGAGGMGGGFGGGLAGGGKIKLP